jgi:hypothetical protein
VLMKAIRYLLHDSALRCRPRREVWPRMVPRACARLTSAGLECNTNNKKI